VTSKDCAGVTSLRSFTNQHVPLGAKYYNDQKLGNKSEYENAGKNCDWHHQFCDSFLRTSLLVVLAG
jgi:hypothetical protein